MANYYGFMRSNYFKVKNLRLLAKELSLRELVLVTKDGQVITEDNYGYATVLLDDDDKVIKDMLPYVAFYDISSDCYPSTYYEEYDEDGNEIGEGYDICPIIQEMLFPDQVCAIKEIGYEKRRYLTAEMTLITTKTIEVYTLEDVLRTTINENELDDINIQLEY